MCFRSTATSSVSRIMSCLFLCVCLCVRVFMFVIHQQNCGAYDFVCCCCTYMYVWVGRVSINKQRAPIHHHNFTHLQRRLVGTTLAHLPLLPPIRPPRALRRVTRMGVRSRSSGVPRPRHRAGRRVGLGGEAALEPLHERGHVGVLVGHVLDVAVEDLDGACFWVWGVGGEGVDLGCGGGGSIDMNGKDGGSMCRTLTAPVLVWAFGWVGIGGGWAGEGLSRER